MPFAAHRLKVGLRVREGQDISVHRRLLMLIYRMNRINRIRMIVEKYSFGIPIMSILCILLNFFNLIFARLVKD
jgi:hypothetical protein